VPLSVVDRTYPSYSLYATICCFIFAASCSYTLSNERSTAPNEAQPWYMDYVGHEIEADKGRGH
jgi:hypothetical protein